MPTRFDAVDALEAGGDHGLHAEQIGALRGPVARLLPVPYSCAGKHDERHVLGLVASSRRRRSTSSSPPGKCRVTPPFVPGDELVADADVRERAARHHAVVAAASRRSC
jgi:hypothetical protein